MHALLCSGLRSPLARSRSWRTQSVEQGLVYFMLLSLSSVASDTPSRLKSCCTTLPHEHNVGYTICVFSDWKLKP